MSTIVTLPSIEESERALLGAILLDQSGELVTETVAEGLRAEHFALDSHRRIFSRMAELSEAGKPVETITVINKLTEHREIESVGGLPYISDLSSLAIRRSSAKFHVDSILEKARLRDLYHACNRGCAMVLEGSNGIQECYSAITDALLEIEAQATRGTIKQFCEFSDDTFNNLLAIRAEEREVVGLPTGIYAFDKLTTGLRKGELMLLGGRTGEGKSCFASQVARRNARFGVPIGFISPEMTKEQILMRCWAHETGIHPNKLRDPNLLTDEEVKSLKSVIGKIGLWPIHCDDTPGITVSQMAARARLLVQRHKCELLIIDYVQLIQADGRDERQRVTAVSRALMSIKKQLQVPIIALSQMPRPDNPNQRPNKYSFKESGSLENDADLVAAIYRPVDDDNQYYPNTEELDVLKQRQGKIGIIPVKFNEERLCFEQR
jgi:replicative DNA helicase